VLGGYFRVDQKMNYCFKIQPSVACFLSLSPSRASLVRRPSDRAHNRARGLRSKSNVDVTCFSCFLTGLSFTFVPFRCQTRDTRGPRERRSPVPCPSMRAHGRSCLGIWYSSLASVRPRALHALKDSATCGAEWGRHCAAPPRLTAHERAVPISAAFTLLLGLRACPAS
jgi:hypothetical protein